MRRCHLSQIIIGDIESSYIRCNIDGIKYLVRIPQSKVNLMHGIIKDEIAKKRRPICTVNEEILTAVQMTIKGRKKSDGTGRLAEQLADRLGIGPALVYQARRILREGSKKILNNVRSGKMPIKTAYNLITGKEATVQKLAR